MKQYLLHNSYLNGKQGIDAVIIRMTLKPINKDDILDAMNNNFHGFNCGIVTEQFATELIKYFGLSLAHGESYHTGCSVFKAY